MLPQSKNLSKLAAYAVMVPLLALFAFYGCSVNKPESPSWITTWDVPISNKTYNISELLEKLDDSLFVIDSLGNPAFSISQDIDTFAVGNNLTFDGITSDYRDSLGTIDIPAPTDQNATTNLNDVVPVAFGVVPPIGFNYDQSVPSLDKFSWLDIESGTLILQFYNGLEIDLDTFVVTVIDLNDMHTVGVATYLNGLSYLETEARAIDLAGQRISNSLSMTFDGYTPGGVLLNAGPQNLDATMSFSGDITVSAAQAETPAINIVQTISSALTDSSLVQSSSIASGSLQFDISNDTQIPFTVFLSSLNFRNGGMELQINRQVNPGNTTQVNVDLAGYTFSPSDSGGAQYVNIDFDASAPPSAPAQYVISADDSVSVHAAVTNIVFESITGQIKPTIVIIDPVQQDVDIPEGLDQARLTQAEMNLNLYNNSMVDADINLTISGGGNSIIIGDRITGKPSPQSPAQLTVISVASQDLYDFLNPPPAQITISGEAIMNPDFAISTITANDNFYGDFEIYSPFALAISDTISIDLDINETTIDSDARPDNFDQTFKYGAIDVEFDSHLPLGISMTLYIGTIADSTLFDDPNTLVLGPYTLEPGIIDNNGHVIESVLSTVADSLDSNELSIFDNDTLYFGQQINLLPTDSVGVQVLGEDYINIKSNARIQLQVGDNLWNDQ
ncbi:MAG: hypothetical protein V3W18_11220 [candidate division Zixibacteria bacterium]